MTDADASPAGEADDDPPLGTCAQHAVDAWDHCDRCGRFYCDECAGKEPNERYCAECDAKLGIIPWERDRERLGLWRAWWATATLVVGRPRATLGRVALHTDLRRALSFAALSLALLAVVAGVTAGMVTTLQALRAPGASSPAALAAGALYALAARGTTMTVLAAVAVAVTPLPLAGLSRGFGSPISSARAAVTVAYTTSFLPLVGLPFVGPWFGFLAVRAVVRELPKELSRTAAFCLGGALVLVWLVAIVAVVGPVLLVAAGLLASGGAGALVPDPG